MVRRPRFGQDLPWPTLVERWHHLEALGFGSALYAPASFLR